MTPSDKKLISRDKGHIFDSSVKLANGKYVKYVPSGAISLSRPNMPPSDKKFLVIRQTSTSANELSHQWAVRFSTAHRLEIRRALYLQPSDKKLGSVTREVLVSLVPSDS